MRLRARLEELQRAALDAVGRVDEPAALRELRVRYLGKKGELTQILRGMGGLPAADRPALGALANRVKERLEEALERRERELTEAAEARRIASEAIDVTLPGTEVRRGHRHPLSRVRREIEDIFLGMGYRIEDGPEVELDLFNFELLNIPPEHPARDMQDTFFVTDEIVLRTQTSPVQVRHMRSRTAAGAPDPPLPVKIVVPGRVYRRDQVDATHSSIFHQVEGLVIDKGITMGDLKGTLLEFARAFYGPAARVRMRPSYFPFTEPSAEVDVSCTFCRGAGCRICKDSGWLEILGAGMVHPIVLQNGGYDPAQVSGFAFGMGIERIAMLKYGVDDMRHFFQNDMRFLAQF